jgi:hypothetical protein
MKVQYGILITLLFLRLSIPANGQIIDSFSASLFMEGLTHPGLKFSVHTKLNSWDKEKRKGMIQKDLLLSPSIGFYFHHRYQTGIFILPELSVRQTNEAGNSFSYGVGAGYMRTIIPRTYEIVSEGNVKKVNAGHNYFLTNYFIRFDRRFSTDSEMQWFIKPQFMYAAPNFPNGVGYFALEMGIHHPITSK